MRASRLLSILMLLQLRGRIPAADLARECEVSIRTIHRDMEALAAAGVPVYAQTGRGGGLQLDAAFRTRLTGLTAAEAAALPLASLPGVAQALGVATDAAAAQLKLLASLPRDASASAQRIAERFHIDPVPWYHVAEESGCLPALASAVWQQRRVTIEYEGWRGGGRRQVDPLGLVQKGGIWYLIAATHRQVRTYRVASIVSLESLQASSQRPRRFDLAHYWSRWTREFEASLIRGRAIIHISAEGRRILRAVAPAAAAMVAATQRPVAPEGWVEAQFAVESAEYTARQLLRLGREVRVIEPAAQRAALVDEARAVVAMYRNR